MRTYLPATLFAIFLFVVTGLWVPVQFVLVANASWVYFQANLLDGLQLRALMGTIAHIFGLSIVQFIWVLQLFRLGWLILLCRQFFCTIPSLAVAMVLGGMFAFSDTMYMANVLGGFVDIAADFFLLLAATMIMRIKETSTIRSQAMTLAALCLAMLIHERSVFGCSLILLWAVLSLGRRAWVLSGLWTGLTAIYLYVGQNHVLYGGPPTYYLEYFQDAITPIVHGDFHHITDNAWSIFSAAGVLWGLFPLIGASAIWRAESTSWRVRYGVFVVAGFMACSIPFFMGGDIQRMVGGIWLPLYIVLIDQAKSGNRIFTLPAMYPVWVMALCTQLMVPPLFSMGGSVSPLNNYARNCMPPGRPRISVQRCFSGFPLSLPF